MKPPPVRKSHFPGNGGCGGGGVMSALARLPTSTTLAIPVIPTKPKGANKGGPAKSAPSTATAPQAEAAADWDAFNEL